MRNKILKVKKLFDVHFSSPSFYSNKFLQKNNASLTIKGEKRHSWNVRAKNILYERQATHMEKKFAIHILNETYLEYRVHMNQ